MDKRALTISGDRPMQHGYSRPGVPIPHASAGPMSSDFWLVVRHYGHALLRHRVVIILTFFCCALSAAALSFWMKPVYRATARVEVGGEVSQIQTLQELYQTSPADEPFLETQVKILESDRIALETIDQLGLQNSPAFAPPDHPGEKSNPASLVDALKASVTIQLIPDTRMMEVNVENHDPQLASAIANGFVDNYMNYSFQKRLDSTNQASHWMQEQLADLKGRVEQSQRALVDYEAQNSIYALGEHENASEARLAELTKDLTDAQNERISKQAAAELVKSDGVDSVFPTEAMQHFQEQYAETNETYVEELSRYGSEFPRVKRLKLELDNYQKAIADERDRIGRRVQGEFLAAQTKEKKLTMAVATQKQAVSDLNSRLVQENLLQHEFQSNQQLYESLMQHQKDVTVSEGLRAAEAHIVDRAAVPARPIRPRIVFNIAVGGIMGLVLGICLALLWSLTENSIAQPDQAEQLLAIPSLGLIPRDVKGLPRFKLPWKSFSPDTDLVVLSRPTSLIADSYRGLRTSIVQLHNESPAKALLITSTHPREGKTRTSVNLAVSLAQRGHKVLLIDTDYRTRGIGQTISSTLGIEPAEAGLIDVLNGGKTLEQSISQSSVVPNLSVILPGRQTCDASDLVSSLAMNDLLSAVRSKFEYIVIDSAPVLGPSDPSSLASIVDGVILVVESETTSRDAAIRAAKVIHNAGGKLLGTVLNKVNSRDFFYGGTERLYFAS